MSIWQKLTTPGTGSGSSATLAPDTAHNDSHPVELHEDELITPENVSAQLIKSVFDGAYMEATIDGDGDVLIRDAVKVFIRVGEKKDRLRMFCLFGFKSNASNDAQLRCANLINSEYIVVTASAQGGKLFFRYDVLLGGGIPKRYLVQALKRFASIPQEAAADHGRDILE